MSRAEAEADSQVAELYPSLGTRFTLEAHAREPDARGITLAQFEAGLRAAGAGGVASAVSGGETFLVYPDGTYERVKGTGYNSLD